MIAAECFPISHHIYEEIEARGWTEAQFCARFVMHAPYAAAHGWFTAELILATTCMKGAVLHHDEADALSKVFGTGPEVWMNLQASYQRWLEDGNPEKPPHPQDD